jgi:hypothetical protein
LVPSWFGINCRIGRATLWLPVQEIPGQFQSFSILVLLPQQDLTDAPPFVHLGAQLLLEHQAEVFLDGRPGGSNRLVFNS